MVVLTTQLRKQIYRAYFDEGLTQKELYLAYCPRPIKNERTIRKLLHEFHRTYTWEKVDSDGVPISKHRRKPLRQRLTPFGPEALKALKETIDANAELYLEEIRRKLRALGYNRTVSQICKAIHRPKSQDGLGYSHLVMANKARQQNYAERMAFKELIDSGLFPVSMMVFLDETHKSRNEAMRRRGWGPTGDPLIKQRPFCDPVSVTMIAACNQDGFIPEACLVTDLGMDADLFVMWVELCLVPVLGSYARGEPNSIVLLDNVSQHWDDRVLAPIRATGAIVIYTPRYSPQWNPIEPAFSWLKLFLLRTTGGDNPRFNTTQAGIRAALKAGARELPAERMRGYFRLCGYNARPPAGEGLVQAAVPAAALFGLVMLAQMQAAG